MEGLGCSFMHGPEPSCCNTDRTYLLPRFILCQRANTMLPGILKSRPALTCKHSGIDTSEYKWMIITFIFCGEEGIACSAGDYSWLNAKGDFFPSQGSQCTILLWKDRSQASGMQNMCSRSWSQLSFLASICYRNNRGSGS